MTDWSDPRILVAIVTGAVGALSGLGGLAFSACVFSKQRKQTRNQAAWEEYRESIYDPLLENLHRVEALAKRCNGAHDIPQFQGEWQACLRNLSERINEVEIACAKADSHDASVHKDWVEHADASSQEVFGLINQQNIGNRAIQRNDPGLRTLGECLQRHVNFFEDRLREQRRALLDF